MLFVSVSERDFLRARGGAMTGWPVSLQAVARAASYGTVTLLTNNGPLVGENLATLAPERVLERYTPSSPELLGRIERFRPINSGLGGG